MKKGGLGDSIPHFYIPLDKMKILLTLLTFGYCIATSFNCSIPESVEDRRFDKSKWTISQFNVEWLFTEPYKDCPGSGCEWNSTVEEYDHMKSIAQVLLDLDADTVHLCEVQSCTQLMQLIDLLPDSHYKPYLIEGSDTYTGQNVGLLTRVDPILPLQRTEDRSDYPIVDSNCEYNGTAGSTGVSKHLITTFSLNGHNYSMVGAHLLSNPNDPTACAKREAQAQVLQNTITSIQQYYDIIVLGDFNDFDDTVKDINNNIPNSRVLSMLKGEDGEKKGSYQLYSVGTLVKQSELYTNWYDPNGDCVVETSEYSTIDHILLSKTLYAQVYAVEYYHKYSEGCNITNSDHYPIKITIGGT